MRIELIDYLLLLLLDSFAHKTGYVLFRLLICRGGFVQFGGADDNQMSVFLVAGNRIFLHNICLNRHTTLLLHITNNFETGPKIRPAYLHSEISWTRA